MGQLCFNSVWSVVGKNLLNTYYVTKSFQFLKTKASMFKISFISFCLFSLTSPPSAGHPRTTTRPPPVRPHVVCGVFTWRTILVGENTRVRMISKPGTRRCRVSFKMAGCGRAMFWCPKFRVPYTDGPSRYPKCSKLDSLDISIPETVRGRRYCNTVARPRIVTKENMKVVYQAGDNHHHDHHHHHHGHHHTHTICQGATTRRRGLGL